MSSRSMIAPKGARFVQRLWWTIGDLIAVFFMEHPYAKHVLNAAVIVFIIAVIAAGIYFYGLPNRCNSYGDCSPER